MLRLLTISNHALVSEITSMVLDLDHTIASMEEIGSEATTVHQEEGLEVIVGDLMDALVDSTIEAWMDHTMEWELIRQRDSIEAEEDIQAILEVAISK